jgi:hypothetical protein
VPHYKVAIVGAGPSEAFALPSNLVTRWVCISGRDACLS